MIRVLIVDDEILIRSLIVNSIDWQKLGFEIAGEADNGKKALEMIRSCRPQLLIVDINMPGMNGLDLARIVKQKYPDIKIILLTGYGDFEYARSAISIGISFYILKPINESELKEALISTKNEIQSDQKRNRYIGQLESETLKSQEILKTNFLKELVSFDLDSNWIQEKIHELQLEINSEGVLLLVAEIDKMTEFWQDRKDQSLWLFAVENILDEVFSASFRREIFRIDEMTIVCILSSKDHDISNYMEKGRTLAGKVQKLVNEYLNFTISVGISRVGTGYSSIRKLYLEALSALEMRFYTGKDSLNIFEGKQSGTDLALKKSLPQADKLLMLLRTTDSISIVQTIEQLLANAVQIQASKENVLAATTVLIDILERYLEERELTPGEIMGNDSNMRDRLNQIHTLAELKQWLLRLFAMVLNYQENSRSQRKKPLVDQARSIIEENYSRPELSLREISERMYINPCYLSKVFKQETNYSLIEYIRDYRLEKAVQIMNEAKEKAINEISTAVGYIDPLYFSKIFKNKYGLSPQKYIRKKRV